MSKTSKPISMEKPTTESRKKLQKAKNAKKHIAGGKVKELGKIKVPYKHKIIDAFADFVPLHIVIRDNMRRYTNEVIEDRAVPDFRDGLKPVQRRILYCMMNDINLSHLGSTRKCAAVVGAVLGSYHPHGDSSVYDALTKLYHKRYPLVMPRGNFGNEISSASAYRYTEVKFTKLHQEIFADKDVMERVPNFDGHTTEPLVINSRLPLFLMNGCSGIAIGFSVNVPPHNLHELVDALIYTVKHFKTAKVADLLKYIQGPDYRRGGKLLSKKPELLEVYRTGHGALEFQCEYNLTKDDEGRTIINVIGYPDEEFNVDTFIKQCIKMQERGLVYSIEDDYIESRYGDKAVDGELTKTVIARVTVSNKKGFDAVMKKLTVRGNYEFYSTEREEDGITLKTYGLLDLLKNWIRWRRVEETKVLNLDIQKAKRALWSEETRLLAMQPKNIDIIADGLKQAKVSFEEYLVKKLKVTDEQAKFIADLKVGSLRKASIVDQEKKIKAIKEQLATLADDLVHISRVIIRHLKALAPYFDDRRTLIGARIKDTSKITVEHTGDPIVMLASREGKLFTNVTEKGSTTADVIATASYEGSVIFDESGLTQILSTTECDGKAGPAYKNIVGIAPQETEHILVIGKNGHAVKIQGALQQKQSEFQAIKGTPVIAGLGVNHDSQVLIWGKKQGEFACLKADKIKEIRKNTAGAKIVAFKPARALVVHNGQYLYTEEGTRVAPAKAGDSVDKVKLFTLSDRNIVIYKSGRRKFMDKAATVKEIAKDSAGVRFVYSASIPGSTAVVEQAAKEVAAKTKKTKKTKTKSK